jgi:hypothetical protein
MSISIERFSSPIIKSKGITPPGAAKIALTIKGN